MISVGPLMYPDTVPRLLFAADKIMVLLFVISSD